MSQESAQSDVVKKGLLKYRASKVKGTAGSSAQGPKSAKQLFVVFRAMHTGDKILHMYLSDKKYHEAENPKWRVYLHDATSVYFLTDKKSFCVSMSDGGLLFFDATLVEESEEWVRCLNAVLYAKGLGGESTLQYEVDMLPSAIINHSGPSVLELRDHDLIIWKSDTWDEVVRWKLNHLRSFKAKKYKLTIVAGKRSCTGLGEFVFNSNHSIQITHAIETIVAKVKYRSSPTPGAKNSHHSDPPTDMPRLQLPSNVPDMRDPRISASTISGGSIISRIPDFAPPGALNSDALPPTDEYGKLEHVQAAGLPPHLRPNQLLLEMPGGASGYGRMDRQTSRSPRNSPPERRTPPRRGQLPSPPREMPSMDEYGKLEHASKGKNIPSSPPRIKHPMIRPSKPGYEDLDLPPIQNNGGKGKNPPASPPRIKHPVVRPSKPGYEDIDLDLPPPQGNAEEYGKLERNGRNDITSPLPLPPSREKSKSPILSRRGAGGHPAKPTPYAGETTSPESKPLPIPNGKPQYHQDDYRHLDRAPSDVYDTVDDAAQVVHPEQYGKLSHMHFTSQSEDEYGKLDPNSAKGGSLRRAGVSSPTVLQTAETRMKSRHTVHTQLHTKQAGMHPEEYGKLDRGAGKGVGEGKREKSHSALPECYGRLERSKATPQPGFDPYGSLPPDPEQASITSNSSVDSVARTGGTESDLIEEEYSTAIYSTLSNTNSEETKPSNSAPHIYSAIQKKPKKPPKPAPPPGYENTVPLGASAAQLAASRSQCESPTVTPPAVPPRAISDKNKLRYENIGEDGRVLQPSSTDDSVSVALTNRQSPTENDYTEDIEKVIAGRVENVVGGAPKPAPRPRIKPKPKQRMTE